MQNKMKDKTNKVPYPPKLPEGVKDMTLHPPNAIATTHLSLDKPYEFLNYVAGHEDSD